MAGVEVLDDWALPTVVQKGDKVDLRCNYKLEGENMYSLKWYRDNVGITLSLSLHCSQKVTYMIRNSIILKFLF